MTDLQPHVMNSNSNSIEQMYSVQGDTSQISKKEYLAKRKAEKRYRELLKAAKKSRLTLQQYATKQFDCSVDEYCGKKYIQSDTFQGMSLSIPDDQVKVIKKANTRIKKDIPFYVHMNQVHITIQAILYNQSNAENHYDLYYIPDNNVANRVRIITPNYVPKLIIRDRIGTEHYTNKIYIYFYHDGREQYVNIVDYVHIYFNKLRDLTDKLIQSSDEIEIEYEDLSYKQLTEQPLPIMKVFSAMFKIKDAGGVHTTSSYHLAIRNNVKQHFASCQKEGVIQLYNSINY